MGSNQLISLPRLTSFLDKLAAEEFVPEKIESFFGSHQLEFDELLPYIYFREDSYGRNLVCRKENYELLVLSWLPNQSTPIHDHNGQRSWMWIHSGKLTLRNYRHSKDKKEGLQICGPDQIVRAGELTYIDDQIGLHEIVNSSGKPAVSLHLYAEPISQCRCFDPKTKTFEMRDLEIFNPQEIEVPRDLPPKDLLD